MDGRSVISPRFKLKEPAMCLINISKLRLLAVVAAAFLFQGCAMMDRFLGEEEYDKPASQLMMEGMEAFERGRYEAATESFQQLKDRYPYSKYAVQAELKMADAFYKRELYDDAFDAYDEFETLHPKNRRIPYVIYQKGMCHFEQVRSIDRDQSHTIKAKEEFERLLKKYSESYHAKRARRKIRECFVHLASYELYVARFYFKKGKYRTAMGRYLYLLENYPDFGQYHEALEYLSRCKRLLAREKEKP